MKKKKLLGNKLQSIHFSNAVIIRLRKTEETIILSRL